MKRTAPATDNKQDVMKAETASTKPVPAWIDAMHKHYHMNGYYRAVDLQRVLGDPTASAGGTASLQPAVSHSARR